MERSSAALAQFERELNVINPEEKTSILSARLLQLNTEYTNAQADRVRKESAWQSVQERVSRSGPGLDPGRESQDTLREARRSAAEVRRRQDPLSAPIIPSIARLPCRWRRSSGSCSRAVTDTAQRVEVEYRESVNREAHAAERPSVETKAEFDQPERHVALNINPSSARQKPTRRFTRSWFARSRKPVSTPVSRTARSGSPIRRGRRSNLSSPT